MYLFIIYKVYNIHNIKHVATYLAIFIKLRLGI